LNLLYFEELYILFLILINVFDKNSFLSLAILFFSGNTKNCNFNNLFLFSSLSFKDLYISSNSSFNGSKSILNWFWYISKLAIWLFNILAISFIAEPKSGFFSLAELVLFIRLIPFFSSISCISLRLVILDVSKLSLLLNFFDIFWLSLDSFILLSLIKFF
jgi:hypothetical protein